MELRLPQFSMSPTNTERRGPDRVSKALLLSCGLLAALLFTLGLMSSWFFKRVDGHYSQLLARTATDLNSVHDIAFHAGISYANIVQLPLAADPQKRTELLRIIEHERAANDAVYDSLQRTTGDANIRVCLEDVIAKRSIFRKQSDIFIARSSQESEERTQQAIPVQLLLAFVDYQKSCDKLGDQVEAGSLKASAAVAAEVRRLRSLFFTVAMLPIGLAGLLILILLYAILYLAWTEPLATELGQNAPKKNPADRAHLSIVPGQ